MEHNLLVEVNYMSHFHHCRFQRHNGMNVVVCWMQFSNLVDEINCGDNSFHDHAATNAPHIFNNSFTISPLVFESIRCSHFELFADCEWCSTSMHDTLLAFAFRVPAIRPFVPSRSGLTRSATTCQWIVFYTLHTYLLTWWSTMATSLLRQSSTPNVKRWSQEQNKNTKKSDQRAEVWWGSDINRFQ